MDNQRLLVWALFGLIAWFTYQTWITDHAPQPASGTPASTQSLTKTPAGSTAPGRDDNELPTLDDAATQAQVDVPESAQAATGVELPAADATVPVIHVHTDVYDIDISTRGGTIQRATLLRYPVTKDHPDQLVDLVTTNPERYEQIQSGILTAGGESATHTEQMQAAQSDYTLGDADELVVPLTWVSSAGVKVVKQFHFRRGSYAIALDQQVTNGSNAPWVGGAYTQILRRPEHTKRTMFDVKTYSFDGPVYYDGKHTEKLKQKALDEQAVHRYTSDAGWLASIQHHFLSAMVPASPGSYNYQIATLKNGLRESMLSPKTTLAPGAEKTFSTTLFVGPKLQKQLAGVEKSLKLTVDYGWLTVLSQPLFWVLSHIEGVVGNWGIAIILMTALIKLVFYKLTKTSGRSMAKMRNLQPRMKALQDRYKDDRPALSQAMMELYKREKVNPAAGCLPILVQMPFFLAFYWVLLESVEMRQAPFILWITDLSARDPYFILPLIMGVAMLVQQRLNPAPADPIQAKVMQVMPVLFTGFFAFFPAGLVLYWCTNTILSIVQQYNINKSVEAEAKAQKAGNKKKARSKQVIDADENLEDS